LSSSTFIWLGIVILVLGAAGLAIYAVVSRNQPTYAYEAPKRRSSLRAKLEPPVAEAPAEEQSATLLPAALQPLPSRVEPVATVPPPETLAAVLPQTNENGLPEWPRAVGVTPEDVADPAMRLEMVQRLAFLRQPWCMDTLRAAQLEERDLRVAMAIREALARR
jgi:hypothetical protein